MVSIREKEKKSERYCYWRKKKLVPHVCLCPRDFSFPLLKIGDGISSMPQSLRINLKSQYSFCRKRKVCLFLLVTRDAAYDGIYIYFKILYWFEMIFILHYIILLYLIKIYILKYYIWTYIMLYLYLIYRKNLKKERKLYSFLIFNIYLK